MFLRLPTHSSTLQEVEILPTLVYFHPKRLILGEILCKGPKGLFGLTRNSLRLFYGLFRAGFRTDFGGCLWPILGLICGRFSSLGVTSLVDYLGPNFGLISRLV